MRNANFAITEGAFKSKTFSIQGKKRFIQIGRKRIMFDDITRIEYKVSNRLMKQYINLRIITKSEVIEANGAVTVYGVVNDINVILNELCNEVGVE